MQVVKIPASDLKVGDVVSDFTYHDRGWSPREKRFRVTNIRNKTIDGEFIHDGWVEDFKGWGRLDEPNLVVWVERPDYANPESAARLRDYLIATCRLPVS